MTIKGIFFDFGHVIGFPLKELDRKYFYLDWNGIHTILQDPELVQILRPQVGRSELESFFQNEIYEPFVQHEHSDFIDPQSHKLLLEKFHQVFVSPLDQYLMDRVLTHINTMKYISIDLAARSIIYELKQNGYWLSLVSNMMLPGKLLLLRLDDFHVRTCFDNVVISSDVGYIKPHPEIFRCALKESKLNPEEVLFIGDTYQQDILGAKQVGLRTVWLNSRHEPQDLAISNPPDYEIKSINELLPLIDSSHN